MPSRNIQLITNPSSEESIRINIRNIASDIYRQELNTSGKSRKFLQTTSGLAELYNALEPQKLIKLITHLAVNCRIIKEGGGSSKISNYLDNFLANEQAFISQVPSLFSTMIEELEFYLIKHPKVVGLGIFGSWLDMPNTLSDLDCVVFGYRDTLGSSETREIQYGISNVYRDIMSAYRSSRYEYAGATFPYPNFDLSKTRPFFSKQSPSILVVTQNLEDHYIIHHRLQNSQK